MGLEATTTVDYKFERGNLTAREGAARRIQNRLAAKKGGEGQPAARDPTSD